MQTAQNGLFVSVHYKGTLADGKVFDSSLDRAPLEVAMGKGQMIPGFENAIIGMALNEKKTVTLTPEEAYGLRDESLERSFNRSDIPPEFNPEVGQTVALQSPQGQQIPAQIIHVDDEKISVDLNHPLAGETLTFEIEVMGISDTPTQANSCASGCGCDCDSDSCG